MDREKYLERIGFAGEAVPTFSTLCTLQKNHLFHIPFENLDVHRKIPIVLEKSLDKIVEKHRGGICYELNSAFYALLKDIGFETFLISGRVYDAEKNKYGPEFDHMAIVVSLNNALYLVDVGFGEFCSGPLRIDMDIVQSDPRGNFKIEQPEDGFLLVSKQTEFGYKPEYLFTLQPRELMEFHSMCLFHQSSPESHFTRKRICSLPVENGRISLTDNVLKITVSGDVKIRHMNSDEEINEVLKNYFGIILK